MNSYFKKILINLCLSIVSLGFLANCHNPKKKDESLLQDSDKMKIGEIRKYNVSAYVLMANAVIDNCHNSNTMKEEDFLIPKADKLSLFTSPNRRHQLEEKYDAYPNKKQPICLQNASNDKVFLKRIETILVIKKPVNDILELSVSLKAPKGFSFNDGKLNAGSQGTPKINVLVTIYKDKSKTHRKSTLFINNVSEEEVLIPIILNEDNVKDYMEDWE